jgi:S1-C subfamily serine protease
MKFTSALVIGLLATHLCAGQPAHPQNAVNGPTKQVQPASPDPASVSQANFEKLSTELAELRKKIERPPKDTWDKLAALSGLGSGIIVALIGFYATNVYNRRQKATEERRKDQELLIAQIQTVEKFIPHLSSQNEQAKSAALVAIAALGNDDLAVKLATAFGGRGATQALTTIASSPALDTTQQAVRALRDMLGFLKPRVVTVHVGQHRRASGFIVSNDGLIVTTAHAVADLSSSTLTVGLPNETLVPAIVVKVDQERDLALLSAQTTEVLIPLDLSPITPALGEKVVALLVGLKGDLRVQIGTVSSLVSQPSAFGEASGERIGVSMNVEPGASGAPVVDREGRLLGLVHSTDQQGTTFLVSADEALAFVSQVKNSTGDQERGAPEFKG